MDVDTSSSNSRSSVGSHPRRPPAHKSVSLLHSPRPIRARSHEPGNGPATRPPEEPIKRPTSSPSSLKPTIGKDDSGESSNAEKWFEKSNNHASRNSTSYVDNSPPFFLQNSSSDDMPPQGQGVGAAAPLRHQLMDVNPLTGSLHPRPALLGLDIDNSSTEDFRSVIDDLTIENKKLKRKLKTYEKLHDSHLKDQKLFEVRVHGLPTSKKKELEEMLRQFALGLNPNPEADSSNMYGSLAPTLVQQKSGSSAASNPFGDSAYASASASGQGSSSLSLNDTKKKSSSSATSGARHRQRHIQTFLHDIPPGGLLTRHPSAMSEKAKKKLIVRRLEQIFAGKGAVTGNSQPQQQQEVSQLAARMDRTAMEDQGYNAPTEGIREAMIMSEIIAQKEAENEHSDKSDQSKQTSGIPKTDGTTAHEQRPTRPLDLDIYRAQVPTENMNYMRHLGFSPPRAETMSPPEDGHGWIYLNLLSNMAQLHTLNVTPEFIRKAIQDHSKKFELSTDERKVRWKGGKSVTNSNSDGGTTPSVGNLTIPLSDRDSPRKRIKTSQEGSNLGSRTKSQITREQQKLAYTPLFCHRSSLDDSDSSMSGEEDHTTESPFPFHQAGDSSGMTSSGIKTTSTKRKKIKESGPIIFYNNAKFCTDLSGEAKTEEAMLYNAFLYHSIASMPVGTGESGSTYADSDTKGPLATTSELPEPMDLDDNPIPDNQEIKFPTGSPLSTQQGKDRRAFQFEVSGLGGVWPADNFAINVASRHARLDDTEAPAIHRSRFPQRYPARIADVLSKSDNAIDRKARMAYHKEIINASTEEFPPSNLPDASCFMPAGDTSPEDYDSDADEEAMSISPVSIDGDAPSAAPQRLDMEYDSPSEEEGDDEDEESEFGSLDLLATARRIDPEAIRKSEREYDADMADRLAEEIPAGSSAATAGGGSGFGSPASGVDKEEWEAARRQAREKQKGVGKALNSKKTQGTEQAAGGILKRRRSEVVAVPDS